MNTSNRGMYAEELVNRTNSYYYDRSVALIEKRYLPIKLLKDLGNGKIIGKLLAKSYVDYCGIYQGIHLEFEVKQTNERNFNLSLIQEHQLRHLINVNNHHGVAFLIIYFNCVEKFYFVPIKWILNWMNEFKSNTIKYEYIVEHCQEIEISYPGIIDYLKFINKD